jgi:hypothetical protein
MLDLKKIINEINRIGGNFFLESTFYLNQVSAIPLKFSSTGDCMSIAVNNNKNANEQIKVVKWFDDFWIYIEIMFSNVNSKKINTFFTLSVFEGEANDDIKNQLFRAEWDSYDNNSMHPQPHWHFYSNSKIENFVGEFIELIDKPDSGFEQLLNEEKTKGIDLVKFHFAMCASWNNNLGHIHEISDETILINWFQGLLFHIKNQLEYVK